jgi:hypothetical protein
VADKPGWACSKERFLDTCKDLRVKFPTVPWWKMVWFSMDIPRHAAMVGG